MLRIDGKTLETMFLARIKDQPLILVKKVLFDENNSDLIYWALMEMESCRLKHMFSAQPRVSHPF